MIRTGFWLHFETAEGLSAGVALSALLRDGDVINKTLEAWAREQLDKQKVAHRRFHLHPDPLPPAPANEFLKEGNEERTDVPGARPSSPVEGGY